MKINRLEILFKLIWVILFLATSYIFCWLTFFDYTFGNIGKEKHTIWNLVIPNILTIGILIIYTKELLFGYHPKSNSQNIKSLFLFLFLIVILIFLQFSQFIGMLNKPELDFWPMILAWIIILASYIGLIGNRILLLKTKI